MYLVVGSTRRAVDDVARAHGMGRDERREGGGSPAQDTQDALCRELNVPCGMSVEALCKAAKDVVCIFHRHGYE